MIKALTWDVFGTVVDWSGTIVRAGMAAVPGTTEKFWLEFAETWASKYNDLVWRSREGEGWTRLGPYMESAFYDVAYEKMLDLTYVLDRKPDLPTTWNRLDPWEDATAGFAKLHGHVDQVALTNADDDMLKEIARHTKLPWTSLVGSNRAKAFKPDHKIYRSALDALGLQPSEVMMVAAHTFDIDEASKLGFRTALIARKGEGGSDPADLKHKPDIIADDINAFAEELLSHDLPDR